MDCAKVCCFRLIATSIIVTYANAVPLDSVLVSTMYKASTENVTAHICPGLCLIGNMTTCVPPPCPFPPCVDRKKIRPLDCCEICPNGPNCQGPDGHIIKYDHWEIIDGKNCSCTQPPSTATCV